MWMEEHIGKRVNHERVDEALATVSDGAKIATGCPFCRVMMTDGLTDRQDEGKGEGVEVLDVAQLLLAAIDTSTVTLPPKHKPEQKPEQPAAPAPAPAAAAPSAPAAADTKEAKPVTGLGLAGGAKRPGAKKAAPAAAAPAAPAAAPTPAEAAPVKGLGIAAGARRPGAKKSAPPAEPTAAEPTLAAAQPESTAQTPAPEGDGDASAPTPPVKGLGIARGARPPGKR